MWRGWRAAAGVMSVLSFLPFLWPPLPAWVHCWYIPCIGLQDQNGSTANTLCERGFDDVVSCLSDYVMAICFTFLAVFLDSKVIILPFQQKNP